MTNELPHEFVIVDEQGHPRKSDSVLSPEVAAEILRNIRIAENRAFITEVAGQKALVEAFDEPLVGKAVLPPKTGAEWTLELPYGVQKYFSLSSLNYDEWDRFHGVTTENVPFVLSASAQNQLFNLMDEFTDDSLNFQGKEIFLSEWLVPKKEVETEAFWSDRYKSGATGWDLGAASPVLKDLLPRLKIPKARVLVLGAGPGHDAAFFANQGHVVTALDISAEALQKAKENYPLLENINWVQADVFKLPQDWQGQFDVIFEHTCYCAINPQHRKELVKIWLRLLAPQGYLLGVFFTMEMRQGPPFGGSEWEIRKRLQNRFHFLFWGRWRQSIQKRNGLELAVYAQKKSQV